MHHRALRIGALVKRLSIPGGDEQGVVDADTDPDHRGHLWRERWNVEDSCEQCDQREADTDAEQRGHDRQTHREQRTECEQQDQDRGDDPDSFASGLGLVGEHRAAELDLEVGRVRGLDDVAHVRGERHRHVVGLDVELNLCVRDRRVVRDEATIAGRVRRRDRRHMRLLSKRREDGIDGGLHVGVVDGAVAAHLEHEVAGVALSGEVATEHVECTLRLAAR